MTQQEIREFYKHQIEWHNKEIAWHTSQIEFLTRELERSRKEDRELVEYVWSKGVMTQMEMEIYGDKFESIATHKTLLERRREYLRRKKAHKDIAKYEKLLAEM